MISLFLQSGASLAEPVHEYVTYKGFLYQSVSVIHLALFRKDAETVVPMLLAKLAADKSVLDFRGAEIRPHEEKHASDKSLVNFSAKECQNVFRGVSPLHVAVALNRKKLVKLLLDAGASVEVKAQEVSFRYRLTKHAAALANANRAASAPPVTHGFHSYEDRTVTQLAFLTEREDLATLCRAARVKPGAGAEAGPAEEASK